MTRDIHIVGTKSGTPHIDDLLYGVNRESVKIYKGDVNMRVVSGIVPRELGQSNVYAQSMCLGGGGGGGVFDRVDGGAVD